MLSRILLILAVASIGVASAWPIPSVGASVVPLASQAPLEAAPEAGGDSPPAGDEPGVGEPGPGAGTGEAAEAPPTAGAALAQQIPDRAELLEELYKRLAAAGEAESAAVLEKAIEGVWLRSGSDTIDLLMERAAQLQQSGDVGLALRVLASVTELEPEYAEGWNRRAFVFFSEGDYARALQDLQRTLRVDQRHFQAISGLATILRELGDNASALKAYRKALEIHPFLESARKAVDELEREVEGQGI